MKVNNAAGVVELEVLLHEGGDESEAVGRDAACDEAREHAANRVDYDVRSGADRNTARERGIENDLHVQLAAVHELRDYDRGDHTASD